METSHKFGIQAARLGLFPRETRPDPPSLRITVWGRDFPNPLGGLSGGCTNVKCRGADGRHGRGWAGLVRERAMTAGLCSIALPQAGGCCCRRWAARRALLAS
jgi:hypothetical protein